MARPSVNAERKETILQAYEYCVANYGVDGATSQKVAEIAGLARPLVRYHVGNNDELLNLLVDRLISRSDDDMAELLKLEINTAEDLVEILYNSYGPEQYYNDIMIYSALTSKLLVVPDLKEKLAKWMESSYEALKQRVLLTFPNITDKQATEAGILLFSTYCTMETLKQLNTEDFFKQVALQVVIDSLNKLEE